MKIKLNVAIVFLSTLFVFSANCQPRVVNWAGKYRYQEKPVKALAGYYMVMEWSISITKTSTQYQAVIEVNGQQTYFKMLADVIDNGNGVRLLFNKLLDGVEPNHKKGELLLTLVKANYKLITAWAALTPGLAVKYPQTCACFVKK